MGKNEQYQPVMQYALNERFEDEISLVDLWIELTRFKRTFWSVFVVVVVLGVAGVFSVYEDKFSLTSMIQIGSVQTANQIAPLETPEALRSKLHSVLVPQQSFALISSHSGMSEFDTKVEVVKNSNVVTIQNKVKPSDLDMFREFQRNLANLVIADHRKKSDVYQSATLSSLNVANIRLQALQDPRTLQLQVAVLNDRIESDKARLIQLQKSYQQLQQSSEQPAQLDQMLETNQALQTAIEKNLRDLEIEKLVLSKQNQDEILQQKAIIADLQRALKDVDLTRLVSEPVRSLEPVNMSKSKLTAIVIVVAVFLATMITFVAMFNEKVKQRRAEQQA